jgi:hypothetical protein
MTELTDLELIVTRDVLEAQASVLSPTFDGHRLDTVLAEILRRVTSWRHESGPGLVPTLDPSDRTECHISPRLLARLPMGSVLRDATCVGMSSQEAGEATGSFIEYRLGPLSWLEIHLDHFCEIAAKDITLGDPYLITDM